MFGAFKKQSPGWLWPSHSNLHFKPKGERYAATKFASPGWVKAPSGAELTRLTQTLARRIGRHLERQGLLERDAENSYLAGDGLETGPMEQLLGSSITYRIAVGPQQGRKVFTLQTLPACDEPFDDGVGKVAGFSLHAGVAARADQRQKLERLCRYISRPAISEKRLSLTPNGNIRYQLKTPYRDGTTHVIFEPLDFIARLAALVPKPRVNLTRFHGVFAPNSKYRARVTPARRGRGGRHARTADPEERTPAEHRAAMTWAQRLKRVLLRDRHRDLPGLRWGGADHRVHRGSRRHREDPHPPGRESARARSHPAASLPGAAAAGAVRRDGVTTPGRPRLGFAVSGMAMAAAGRETGGEGESAPAPLSLG
jgi:hypothetical protein